MVKNFLVEPKHCISTHGGSGYAPGSYWDNGVMVCGACGTRIDKPRSTGENEKFVSYGSVKIEKPKKRHWYTIFYS